MNINITSNLQEIIARRLEQLVSFDGGSNADKMLRTVATTLSGEVHDRIHVRGEDASGSQTGTYSNAYLKLREKKNRGADSKVILSLTKTMETDFGIVAISSGGYGLGYKNEVNFNKANWCEETYKKKIFALTPNERTLAVETAEAFVKDALSK